MRAIIDEAAESLRKARRPTSNPRRVAVVDLGAVDGGHGQYERRAVRPDDDGAVDGGPRSALEVARAFRGIRALARCAASSSSSETSTSVFVSTGFRSKFIISPSTLVTAAVRRR